MPEKITVVGLGYVGMSLAIALAKHFRVIGFGHIDRNADVLAKELQDSTVFVTADEMAIDDATVYIVCVPASVDEDNRPDFRCLASTSELIGRHLKPGDLVIYESTVYPGTTEEVCGNILHHVSGLSVGAGFQLAYSPERINPGDALHTIDKVTKVVGANDEMTHDRVARIYGTVVPEIFRCSIQEAEACKLLENVQRDVNIALMNEFAMLCGGGGISMRNVLNAARTKWDFVDFYPGLVGGHYSAVDPHYVVAWGEAQRVPKTPVVAVAARMTNGYMGTYTASVVRRILKYLGQDSRTHILIMGAAFKPNVRDTRNSLVKDIVEGLAGQFGLSLYDPEVSSESIEKLEFMPMDLEAVLAEAPKLAAVIVATAHHRFRDELPAILERLPDGALLADVEGRHYDLTQPRLAYWSL